VRVLADASGRFASTLRSLKRFVHDRYLLFLGVGGAAVAIAVALILVSVLGSSSADSTPSSPMTTAAGPGGNARPTKVPGAAATAALFKRIPQSLNQLGDPNAKVTMIEFADPQCPYCRQFALDALPAIVREYVRAGKVKLVLFGIQIIGPNSEDGLRAVYAAGLQGKLWEFSDLLYKSQGAENSGWITDDRLRRIGDSIPGFDTDKMMADRSSPDVDAALAASSQQASNARVNQTPTFFAGPTGGRLEQMAITSLTPEAFRPTLEALTE
jgi:protein-disulfide isomerase